MNTEQEKDEQLIRWLENKLSGEELSAFEERKEFQDYNVILESVKGISYPRMDEKAVFSKIQNKIAAKQSAPTSNFKVIQLKRWIFAVASIAILAVAVMTLLPDSNTINAEVGQFVTHTLPDDSEINLSANSQLSYKENFAENRVLQLEGEAFFKVKKGQSFKVETNQGTVSVLGTSFNIFARNTIFIVACKTGKVRVESKNQSYILEIGDKIKLESGKSTGIESVDTSKIGNWTNGESYFSSASLEEVVLSLSSIYDTKITVPPKYQNKKFTGSFIHNDLKKALKMVFSPMQITYTVDDLGNVVLGD